MKYLLSSIRTIIREYEVPVKLDRVFRVLVVDPNYIGDMLFSSPIYRVLKKNLATARIEALVYPFTAEILSANPFIDKIHYLPKGNLIQQLGQIDHPPKNEIRFDFTARTHRLERIFLCGSSEGNTGLDMIIITEDASTTSVSL